MKGNKITGVGHGTTNNDAVNKTQLDTVNEQLDAEIKINKINIATINNHNGYFAYTNQLKHNSENNVKFPPKNTSLIYWHPSIKFPFKLVANDNTKLRLLVDGWYHIIYTDNIKKGGQFQIYDNTNSDYLFVMNLVYNDYFSPFMINAVFEITIDKDLVNYIEIKLMANKSVSTNPNPQLDGMGDSTFFIKYLGRNV